MGGGCDVSYVRRVLLVMDGKLLLHLRIRAGQLATKH